MVELKVPIKTAARSTMESTALEALCIGINYADTDYPLRGCHNDVDNITDYLSKHSTNIHKIHWMKDGKNVPAHLVPTRANMIKQILTLILSSSKHLFLSFSGHGGGIRDTSGDERDGQDEVLFTADEQYITDDELHSLLRFLRPEQTLFILMDCCSSGSGSDLEYAAYLRGNRMYWFRDTEKTSTTIPGKVVMLSGCGDDQTSADAYLDDKYQGALTRTVLDTLTQVQKDPCDLRQFVTTVRKTLDREDFTQVPVLSSSFYYGRNEAYPLWRTEFLNMSSS